jgi:hypothetical protein
LAAFVLLSKAKDLLLHLPLLISEMARFSPRKFTLQNLLDAQPELSRKPKSRTEILYGHFFRRFFDNDNLAIEGETETTVIRTLCAFAVPALMVAFWLMPSYPNRQIWATAADRYFFVLYSFVAMGAVTTFEWEMLFPDRADFLVLLPLGLKASELFYAKAKALLSFLGMFLIAANIFALILYSAVSTRARGNYAHSVYAHFIAVSLSGIFAAFTMLAIQGLTICLSPAAWFRAISTILQSLSITLLLLLFLLFPLFGSHMQTLLEGHAAFATLIPPVWFLGLYEHLIYGASAPAASSALARMGFYATAAAVGIAVITYPLAWSRQRKRALEGAPQARKQNRSRLAALLHKTLLPFPQQRAVFHFISQTISRNTRYQIYLAIYAGVGLALSLCSIVTVRVSSTGLIPALSVPGLHAILPLLLFWMVLGLRSAFAFPVDMRARWVFPINLTQSVQQAVQAARAAKLWTLLCCASLTLTVLGFLLWLHWSYLDLLIQAIAGAALSLLLTDIFFLGRTQIPFTRPRMPGREGLPLILVLYAALFPALVLFTVQLEINTEARASLLIRILTGVIALHILLKITDILAQKGVIGGFPEDEADQGPQTLGLFQ